MFEKVANPNEIVYISIHNSQQSLKAPIFGTISARNIYEFSPLHEIPIITEAAMPIYIKVKSDKEPLKTVLIDSAQGNINTIHLSKILASETTNAFIAKGAHIHRYHLDKDLFYCQYNDLSEKIFKKNIGKNLVLTQNITGTTDTHRIHAAWLESRSVCIYYGASKFKIVRLDFQSYKY